MNLRTEFIISLSYKLIEQDLLLPVMGSEGKLGLSDTQNIFESNKSSFRFWVKLLDGDAISSENIVNDMELCFNQLIEARMERKKPIVSLYIIVVSDEISFNEYKNKTAKIVNSYIENSAGAAILIINNKNGECYSANFCRGIQKKVLKTVSSEVERFSKPEYKLHTKEDINLLLENIAHTAAKFSKIKGFSVTKFIIFLNLFVFIAGEFTDRGVLGNIIYDYGIGNGEYIIKYHEYWRLFTPIFLHGDIVHLLSNMYFLYICGEKVENIYGKWRFISIYIISGIAGNVLSLILLDPKIYSLGASGACMGLGGILFFLWLRRKDNYVGYFSSITSMVMVVIFNVFYGFMFPHLNINNWAHMGGFVAGVLGGVLIELVDRQARKEHN